MLFEPDKITREDVIEAAKVIDSGEYQITESTGYNVLVNGKNYPPKEIMRFAHEKATGVFNWHPGGGEPTNKYLKALGFEIIEKKNTDPLASIIQDYKNLIKKNGNDNEIYKWTLVASYLSKFNTNAPDFFEEVRSVKFSNLIYHNGIAALNHIAQVFPEELRNCFINLYDEKKYLVERINKFTKDTLTIYRKIEPKLYHHQDERTIATYLTVKYPNTYTFYKDSFYRKLCKRLNIKPEGKGKKYVHYLTLVNEFIINYVEKDTELLRLKKEFLTPECFNDEENLIFAQDILYQGLENTSQFDRNYWRVGTVIDDESYWSEMVKSNSIAIGWSMLGDLNESDIFNKTDVQNLLKAKGYYDTDNRTASQKGREIYSFYDEMKNGDIVLAQDGAKILGVGKVKDEYRFTEGLAAPHHREIQWLSTNVNFSNKEGLRTTVSQLLDIDLLKQIDDLITNEIKSEIKMNLKKHSLNQILFGPPGTGKTYNSINYSLEILGEDIKGLSRQEIKKLYERRVKEGRIVFTTFHQSMCYEDFIEGIKPLSPEDTEGQVNYDIEKGIFRMICESARDKSNSNFDDAYNSFLKEISKLDGEPFELKTPTNKSYYVAINSKNNLSLLTGKEKKQQGVFTKDKLIRQLNGEKVFIGWEGYYTGIINILKEKHNLTTSVKNEDKNYVLIIDEINRGNVSQIFGELITLIEEDKREGKEEALEVTLPYSKEKFSVPSNLYIIGTMNTADRSVEALDTALRRRFSFVEMQPDIKALNKKQVGEISADFLSNILVVINNRLEKLLGKDYLIGHSYFMNVSNSGDLKIAFQNKIMPLLQEYFYGDYGKIGLVLGKGFIKIKETEVELFSDFDYDTDAVMDKRVYELVDYTKTNPIHSIIINGKEVNVTFDAAIKLLLNQQID